jgi:hypothetical protein
MDSFWIPRNKSKKFGEMTLFVESHFSSVPLGHALEWGGRIKSSVLGISGLISTCAVLGGKQNWNMDH